MSILVRRSNLLVSIADDDAVKSAWRHDADAITLDLANANAAARGRVRDAIASAVHGAAEVFVRVDQSTLKTDLEAAVWPGLRGIMLTHVDSAGDIASAEKQVAVLERERGLKSGSVQFIAVLETARSVWHVRAIVTASPRITQVVLDEIALAAD
ncbi:MAG: aldolase/citrate lyase family protein, partial [Burkholderiales bacterium]